MHIVMHLHTFTQAYVYTENVDKPYSPIEVSMQ